MSTDDGREAAALDEFGEGEIRAELMRLQEEHRDLDRAIEALEDAVACDRLQLQRLKKRKLQLRDRIQYLEDQILPDIIA